MESRACKDLVDEHSLRITAQTSSQYVLQANQSTGAIYSEEVPIMEPKMHSLTTQELAELKEPRDRNLDASENIAAQEVT